MTISSSSFDWDVFCLSVASQLLPTIPAWQEQVTRNENPTIHLYWRSPVFSTQCIWMDSSWEFQHDQTVWKLGCLWKNNNNENDGGLYVQSDALQESDFRHFFQHDLGVDIDVSSTTGLGKTFATAIQTLPNREPPITTTTDSIPLFFADLETTVAFPLATDTTGTRTQVAPVLVSRLQYTTPFPATDDAKLSTRSEEWIESIQAWKAQVASSSSSSVKPDVLPVAEETQVSNPTRMPPPPSSNPKKRTAGKRSNVQGCYKVQQRSKRKPSLKFAGQG